MPLNNATQITDEERALIKRWFETGATASSRPAPTTRRPHGRDDDHPPGGRELPAPRLAALGLQHVLVMYAGAVAVPLIVGRALKLSPEQVALLISPTCSAAAWSR
jgi:hypothetical protein